MIRGISQLSRPALSLIKRTAIAPSGIQTQFLLGRGFSTSLDTQTPPPTANVVNNEKNAEEKSPRVGLLGQKYEVASIRAVRRETVGKRNAQWARMNDLIPGIIYGGGSSKHTEVIKIYVPEADLRREVHKRKMTFLNTLFDV